MVNLKKPYVNPTLGVAVLKYNLLDRLLNATLNICVCATLLLPLSAKQSVAADVRVACKTDGVMPDIEGLYIEEARNILFSYGWKPRDGKEVNNMGDEKFWFSYLLEVTPELMFCGRVCIYAYEDKGAYLEVSTIYEGEVTAVEGWCKI